MRGRSKQVEQDEVEHESADLTVQITSRQREKGTGKDEGAWREGVTETLVRINYKLIERSTSAFL
jgi:hypothetical protein